MEGLRQGGVDTSLIKVAPNCHIVTDEHIAFDKENLAGKLGTTSKGIAPAYAAKAARTGILAKDVLPKELIWDGKLEYGSKLLCEGAQGVWLDVNHGNYPYVTSSDTLPYGACSFGFPPQKVRNVYGAAKIYDTRSGEDPLFPAELLENKSLKALADLGKEFGVVTGRRRKVNWLNLGKLVDSINLTGSTHIVISKCDIIEQLGEYKIWHGESLINFKAMSGLIHFIRGIITIECPLVKDVTFSYSPETI